MPNRARIARLGEPDVTAEQRASFEKVAEALGRAMPRVDFGKIEIGPDAAEFFHEVGEITKRIRAAKRLPDGHPKREPWVALLDIPDKHIFLFSRFLLDKADPLKAKGRPAQSKIPDKHIAAITRRVARGEKPTPAAKALVGGDKHRADYLVKQWRKRGIK